MSHFVRGRLRVLFDWIGVSMGAGTGSQVQRDTTSNAILAKSFRKELLVNSPVKRGSVWKMVWRALCRPQGMGQCVGGRFQGIVLCGIQYRRAKRAYDVNSYASGEVSVRVVRPVSTPSVGA